MKAKGIEYKPSVYQLGRLYQECTRSIEQIEHERLSCIHLLKDKYQSERPNITLECIGKLNLLKAQFCAFGASDSTTILLTVQNWQITS